MTDEQQAPPQEEPSFEKDFDAELGYEDRPNPRFKLCNEWFACHKVVPYKVWKLTEAINGLDFSIAFVRGALLDEYQDAYDALLDDPRREVTGFALDRIARWLIREHSGRPTEPPVSSGNGAGGTSDGSTASLPETESTTAS